MGRTIGSLDHIGKAVVRIPEDASKLPSTSHAKSFALDMDASYLLTGGLGGLGRSVATWMVERGARNLVFLSRNAGKGEGDKSFFEELSSMGCSVSAVSGRVEDMEAVRMAVKKAATPIKGIVHLAMVLRVSHAVHQASRNIVFTPTGRSYPRYQLRRVDRRRCPESQRRLESPSCACEPASRLFHHG